MDYEKATLSTPKEVGREPDFQQLLNALRKETSENAELVSKVYYYSNTLKTIERTETDQEPMSQEPNSVIMHLWEEVWKLRKTNHELTIITNHLQSVIGS